MNREIIIEKVANALVRAGSTFSQSKTAAYRRALESETDEKARWVMRMILDNAEAAAENRSPLCDDTGIPHLYLEVGPEQCVTGNLLAAIQEGVKLGLRLLPGRPMGILGTDAQRINQSGELSEDPSDVLPAPLIVRQVSENALRLHVLLLGGGPAIRGQTLHVFHRHSIDVVLDEIIRRAAKSVIELGCSPCTLAIGIGRSQMEATALMIEAQIFGNYDCQSEYEAAITRRVNSQSHGPMEMGGHTAVLATFMKVGPQRASGVRIVCIRPCCCFEPRLASVEL